MRTRLGIAMCALVCATSPALSQDNRWNGFYVGAQAGWVRADADWTNVTCADVGCPVGGSFSDLFPGVSFSHAGEGAIGGAHAGYNWQSGRWVTGLEISYSAADAKGTSRSDWGPPFSGDDDFYSTRLQQMLMAGGRLGYTFDRWLVYGKAGLAYARIKTTITDPIAPNTGGGSETDWHAGWNLGAGLEFRLTPSISLGLAYDFVDLRSQNYLVSVSQDGGGTGTITNKVDIDGIHAVTARLSFRLDHGVLPTSPMK